MAITVTITGRRAAAAGLAALALGAGALGCSERNEARGVGDAPVGARDDRPADVTNFPDRFGNVATKCSVVPGKRIWMATHGGNARTMVIESDESCR